MRTPPLVGKEYKVYAQLEPKKQERSKGVYRFFPNIALVRTISAPNKEVAFNIAKTITPHPLLGDFDVSQLHSADE